jgi:hypothetical protein
VRPRGPLTLLTIVTLLLAACGRGEERPSGTTLPPTTAPRTTTTTTPPEPPSGADAVVLEIRHEGGIAGPDPVFRSPPDVLITGDGRLIHAEGGASYAEERTISAAGVDHVLGLAADAGLLADVDYPDRTDIADAFTTVVTVTAGGHTWVHEVYALDDDGGGDHGPERARLATFVEAVEDLGASHPAWFGEPRPFEPAEYLVRARREPEPGDAVRDWPAAAGVTLEAVGGCAAVPAGPLADVVHEAGSDALFADATGVYDVTFVPRFPGRSCG